MAAKTMTITAALHLSFDSRADPTAMLESFDKHLGSLGIKDGDDDDFNMLQFLTTAIATPLLRCCDLHQSLEKEHLDTIHTSLEVIRSITIWISFIYHRAQAVLFAAANGNPSARVLVIVRAILNLGRAEFSLFIAKSLIRVLTSIIRSMPSFETTTLSSIIRASFRSSLIALKSVVGLVNLCHKHKSICHGYNVMGDYSGVYIELRNFLVSSGVITLFGMLFIFYRFTYIVFLLLRPL
jgi:hypothetical protein